MAVRWRYFWTQKSPEPLQILDFSWRRRRDLNSRCGYPHYSLSRGAPSASWVLLHLYETDPLHLPKMEKLAEREGFEPPVPFDITGFQDQRHQPLGHLSISNQLGYYSTEKAGSSRGESNISEKNSRITKNHNLMVMV